MFLVHAHSRSMKKLLWIKMYHLAVLAVLIADVLTTDFLSALKNRTASSILQLRQKRQSDYDYSDWYYWYDYDWDAHKYGDCDPHQVSDCLTTLESSEYTYLFFDDDYEETQVNCRILTQAEACLEYALDGCDGGYTESRLEHMQADVYMCEHVDVWYEKHHCAAGLRSDTKACEGQLGYASHECSVYENLPECLYQRMEQHCKYSDVSKFFHNYIAREYTAAARFWYDCDITIKDKRLGSHAVGVVMLSTEHVVVAGMLQLCVYLIQLI